MHKFHVPNKYYPSRIYYQDLPALARRLRDACTYEQDSLDPKIAFETSWEAIKKHQKEYYYADKIQIYPEGKSSVRVYMVRTMSSCGCRVRAFRCISPCTGPVRRGCTMSCKSVEKPLGGDSGSGC